MSIPNCNKKASFSSKLFIAWEFFVLFSEKLSSLEFIISSLLIKTFSICPITRSNFSKNKSLTLFTLFKIGKLVITHLTPI